ncbi:MAG TPA: SDR family oxidoreductase, partial [Phnomibacter sp.]|nr:SDR family oxidoreductase [Phnomibacter sp.]
SEASLLRARDQLATTFPGVTVHTLSCDLGRPGAAGEVMEWLRQRNILISILVNNAGFGVYGYFSDSPWEREQSMLYLHVLTLTELTKKLLPAMVQQHYGRVLNIASAAAFQPGPLMAVYYASKAYVLNFSQAIGNELQGTGVTVTVMCPGVTPTGFQQAVGNGTSRVKARSILTTDVEYVADLGYNGMLKGRSLVIPGNVNRFLVFLNRLVPRSFTIRMVRRAQEKIRKGADLDRSFQAGP